MTTLEPTAHNKSTPAGANPFVMPFGQIGIEDLPKVGGKNASLGELIRELSKAGISVPDGFATTADAYRHFLKITGLDKEIRRILGAVNVSDVRDLQQRGKQIRQKILETPLPDEIESAILDGYVRLCGDSRQKLAVAVRSSATAEDLPDASFAGQQETYLNISGDRPLLESCRKCFASVFTDRAISYRAQRNFDHFQVALSIGVQRMVRSDLGVAGVMFTIDTETGFRDAVLINASYGLGEFVVKGTVSPDQFVVFKPTLKLGFSPIIQKELGSKETRLICAVGGSKSTRSVPVIPRYRESFSLDDADILQLARWGIQIEEHYSNRYGRPTPMDIEWAKDGESGALFIVQARPETVQSRLSATQFQKYHLKKKGTLLVRGNAIGQRINHGPVRLISSLDELSDFQAGEVLVAESTDPDWEPVMKKAAAIVTDHGGRTCHAAIVARELGVPAVVGTNDGTRKLVAGQTVTVSCAEGETGRVYDGELPFEVEQLNLEEVPRTQTKLMVNIADPKSAFGLASYPIDGVGLARMEFTISNVVKAHPLALLGYDQLDEALRCEIDAISKGYADKSRFFVERLSQAIGMIGAAFFPNDVIVRMSDFKTNEYANLIGGKAFEPTEENPMLGFRGASRYYDPRYRDGFALECQAMKRVRDEMGLSNVKLMIPFCRTVEEGRKVIDEMKKYGLVQGQYGLEIYVMCEIPSNVLLAEEFAKVFDGFSIGSNDLTQLILGLDRDSEIVSHLFDERNEAVKRMIAEAIRKAKGAGSRIGICGQAPSDYPEFARFLVEQGIDSISVTPDVVIKTRLTIADAEKDLIR